MIFVTKTTLPVYSVNDEHDPIGLVEPGSVCVQLSRVMTNERLRLFNSSTYVLTLVGCGWINKIWLEVIK